MNRLGPYNLNTIVVGDCLDVMGQMPDGCVDVVFADPPYGAGKYQGDAWIGLDWLNEAMRLTKSFVLVTPGIENIPLMAYAINGAKVYRQAQDAKRIVIRGKMPNHPCPKPIDAMTWWLKTFSSEGDLIFDPFIGSGTTAVAADRLGRDFFGCDINPDYVEMAMERIEGDRKKRAQLPLQI